MSAHYHYVPPSSDIIQSLQNEDASIRLLLAQRRIYSKAKHYLAIRWIGMAVIGISAPIVSVLWQDLAVVAVAVAGFWAFLGRTLLASRERRLSKQAAVIQERFDLRVFQMPEMAPRSGSPSPEDVALLTANVTNLHQMAAKEQLLDWYPIRIGDSGAVSVAISQRSNAAYTDRLLRTTATVWAICITLWGVLLVIVSAMTGMSLLNFLLGIFLPVLPAGLDVFEFRRTVDASSRDRAVLALKIQCRLGDSSNLLKPDELLSWQDQLFNLRSTTPLIPDIIYWLSRKRNEIAMHAAAEELRGSSRQASSGKKEDS